jgi:Family of unknown function (DUF5670)
MLWIIVLILLLFWGFGFWGPYESWRAGGYLHIVLAIVLILILVQLFGYGPRGRWGW